MRKLIRLAKNITVSNFTDLRLPYRFTYILTYKCQFKCAMCNIWQKNASQELSLGQIEKFFGKYNGFSWINLSGGEIFLREDLPDIIKALFEKCKHLYLLDFPTNGFQTQVIADTVKWILGSYKPAKLLVTVSLDGPKQLHEQIRNVPGSWERAVETFGRLRALRSGNFNVFFGMTLQQANMDSFEETFKSIDKQIGSLRYEDFHINLIQKSGHYYENTAIDVGPIRQELSNRLERIMKLRNAPIFSPIGFLERRYQRLAKIYLDKNISPLPCTALSSSFFMDPAGNIYPCSIYNKAVGNIADFDYDIRALWRSAEKLKAREEIRKRHCPQCWTPCEAYQNILANLLPKFHRS